MGQSSAAGEGFLCGRSKSSFWRRKTMKTVFSGVGPGCVSVLSESLLQQQMR